MAMELVQEAQGTRKLLERIPADKLDWQPHEKSMTLKQLASHLVEIPNWGKFTIEQEEFEFDMETYVPTLYDDAPALLEAFDNAIEECKNVLQGASDEHLMAIWRMKVNGKLAFEMPRVAVLRGMILNHAVHHRAQLGVYLRMQEVPLPSIYGPSADDNPMY